MCFKKSKWSKIVFVFLIVNLLLGTSIFIAPGTSSATEFSVTVTGDGVTKTITYTLSELEAMKGTDKWVDERDYSTINTWPTKNIYSVEGVKLADLLQEAGIKEEATLIKFKARDGFTTLFTKKELLDDARYHYPGLKENHEFFGYIPGSTEGAELVDAILAFNTGDKPHLIFGQRYVTEQTNHAFAKYVSEIEVSTDNPDEWDKPTATQNGGIVPVGTEVELEASPMDADKVYYTIDGSNPTYESPMYNWIAFRWWNSRTNELDEINHPIIITEDTTIKAVHIGMGKADSDIVTFEYTVLEDEPPYIVSITLVDDVSVPSGTAEEDAKAVLAAETTIEDSEGETHTVALSWSIDSYDGATAGNYTATGTFELPEGVEQSDPPMDLEVTATVTVTVTESTNWYVDATGGADFTTIQATVDAANDGDTIIVKDGTYNENVTVDKSLVIKSENGADQTIVQAADGSADVFNVDASEATIDGFTASGATSTDKAGIKLAAYSTGCTITNNHLSENDRGISFAAYANDNIISNNLVTDNDSDGIFLSNVTGNIITDNHVTGTYGTYDYAICLFDNADNNIVSGNIVEDNTTGINVKNADNNELFENTFSNNDCGLQILTGSSGNIFYLNNFVDNTNAQIEVGFMAPGENYWNSQEELSYEFKGTQYSGYLGNYWSDYTGEDADGNGIGDTPYLTITGNDEYDDYPLMGQWQDGAITVDDELVVFTVSGDGVDDGEKGYTLSLLQALGETTAEYTSSGVTHECTGVLLADVLEDAGITDPATEVDVVTTDGFSPDSYSVTLQNVIDDAYLVTYLVDGEPFEDTKEGYDSSTIRIYRNYDDGSGWLNRLTLIAGVEVKEPGEPQYEVAPEEDDAYTIGETAEGIATMTVNSGVSGFGYFAAGIGAVVSHSGGEETVVFTHTRDGSQIGLNATRADFDEIGTAQAGFNVQPGDVVKVYIVDELSNAVEHNPVVLQ